LPLWLTGGVDAQMSGDDSSFTLLRPFSSPIHTQNEKAKAQVTSRSKEIRGCPEKG
jgi:hypothetical protein